MAEQHRESFSLSKAVLGNEQKKKFFLGHLKAYHIIWVVERAALERGVTRLTWRIYILRVMYVDST